MSTLAVFVLGVLVGWLIEWIIDWFYWRRRYRTLQDDYTALKERSKTIEEKPQLKEQDAVIAAEKQKLVERVAFLESLNKAYEEKSDALREEIAALKLQLDEKAAALDISRRQWEEKGLSLKQENEALKLRMQGAFGGIDLAETQGEEAILSLKKENELLKQQLEGKMATMDAASKQCEERVAALNAENESLKTIAANRSVAKTILPDDLKDIKGIGPVIERRLNEAGIYTFQELGSINVERLREILGNTIQRLADEEDILIQARQFAEERS